MNRRMDKKFNKIYEAARKPDNIIPFNHKKDCFVIFSDHHKGAGSSADDFKKNARLYETALSYYEEKGFKLIVLGDNEELWENRYDQILDSYRNLIAKEINMAIEVVNSNKNKKKIRLLGNHDKEISLKRFKRYCKNMDVTILDKVLHRKGICLGEDIFLIHGHQGRFFDDVAWRVSRWAVQSIWKTIQQLFNIGNDGPAENFKIRDDLEIAYYEWAKRKKIMLICGHTHCAIFSSLTYFDRLQIEIDYLEKRLKDIQSVEKKKEIKKEIKQTREEIDKILARRKRESPKSFEKSPVRPVPCYFNDGCCGYTNGITCLEIEQGVVRLVKWQRQKKERVIYAEEDMIKILNYIKKSRSIDEAFEPKLKD
ncbi:MAG: metallophosphoesterase [Candidatus Aminicenantaceae bacterium]